MRAADGLLDLFPRHCGCPTDHRDRRSPAATAVNKFFAVNPDEYHVRQASNLSQRLSAPVLRVPHQRNVRGVLLEKFFRRPEKLASRLSWREGKSYFTSSIHPAKLCEGVAAETRLEPEGNLICVAVPWRRASLETSTLDCFRRKRARYIGDRNCGCNYRFGVGPASKTEGLGRQGRRSAGTHQSLCRCVRRL